MTHENTTNGSFPLSKENAMYAVASRLVGFKSSWLRVRILRTEGSYVWCITADLRDAGTKLVLDASQVVTEDELSRQYLAG
jgi:hypothetical protein